jgi:Glycosyltransferase family 20
VAQLVIVSNRVAIPDRNAKARAGGLEVAVKAALKQKCGIWFGWSGKVAARTKIAMHRVVHDGITYITLDLSKEDHHEYYNGFTNRVLWPILHYRVDLAEFSRRDLSGYLRVNDHFARELHQVLGPDDLVWVHDYHLIRSPRHCASLGTRTASAFSFTSRAHHRKYLLRCPTTSVLFHRFANTISSASRPGMMPSISAVISPENAACTATISISPWPIGQFGSTYSRLASKRQLSPTFPAVQYSCPSLRA